MKKCFVFFAVVMIVFILAACGGGSSGNQTISFQGFTMDIPSSWKAEESTLSDDYAVYEKKDSKGHANKLLLMDTFGLLDGGDYDLQRAGEFFKEVTEDDASYSDPSDPVAAFFLADVVFTQIETVILEFI